MSEVPSSEQSLSELTRDPIDEGRLHRNWHAVQGRRASRSRRGVTLAVGAALAVAAAGTLFLAVRTDLGPLHRADGGALEFAAGVTELSDGSRVSLDEGGSLEVLESSSHRLVLRLATGRARFEVTPGGPRRWIVEAGARVEVVGTIFTLAREGEAVEVAVERGAVLVFHPEFVDGVRRLGADQRVRIGSSSPLAAAPAEEPAALETATPTAPPPSAPALGEPSSPAVRSTPRRRSVTPSLTAEQLMERADLARAHGEPAVAVRWLERLVEDHPEDARASVAAMTLGRLELRRLARPSRAVAAFDRAISLGLPASIAEDTRAMRVEALMRAGRAEDARGAAAEYHRRYPSGRWTEEVERWAP